MKKKLQRLFFPFLVCHVHFLRHVALYNVDCTTAPHAEGVLKAFFLETKLILRGTGKTNQTPRSSPCQNPTLKNNESFLHVAELGGKQPPNPKAKDSFFCRPTLETHNALLLDSWIWMPFKETKPQPPCVQGKFFVSYTIVEVFFVY